MKYLTDIQNKKEAKDKMEKKCTLGPIQFFIKYAFVSYHNFPFYSLNLLKNK